VCDFASAPNFALIGQYGAELWPRNVWRPTSVQDTGFVVTSVFCIGTGFYVANIMLILLRGLSCFSVWLVLDRFLTFLWVNFDQLLSTPEIVDGKRQNAHT